MKKLVIVLLVALVLTSCQAATKIVSAPVPSDYANSYIARDGHFEITNPQCVILEPEDIEDVQYAEKQIWKSGGIPITYLSTPSKVYTIPFQVPESDLKKGGVFLFGEASYVNISSVSHYVGTYLVPIDHCPE